MLTGKLQASHAISRVIHFIHSTYYY